MASPQTENGYTRIANELIEEMAKQSWSGCDFRVMLTVMRRTYGFGKTTDDFTITQMQRWTGLSRSVVCRTLKRLVTKRSLVKTKNGYAINKNWEQWLVTKRSPSSASDQMVTSASDQMVTKVVTKWSPPSISKETYKRNIPKERGASAKNTPAEIAKNFFENQENQERVIEHLIAKGLQDEIVRREIDKFVAYWTEPSKSGRKQRWEMQKTFEVSRRLATWLGNIDKFGARFGKGGGKKVSFVKV